MEGSSIASGYQRLAQLQPALEQSRAQTATTATAANPVQPAEVPLRRLHHAGKATLSNGLQRAMADAKTQNASKDKLGQFVALQDQVITAFKTALGPFLNG